MSKPKLSPETVAELRRMRVAGATYRQLYDHVTNVDHSAIWQAVHGYTYKHVAMPAGMPPKRPYSKRGSKT